MSRAADPAATRADLLDRGFDVFAAHGYAAVSMRKLASSLGATTGTLYHYFDGKQAFFEEMIRHMAAKDVARAMASVDDDDDTSAAIDALLRFLSDNLRHLQDFVSLALDYVRHEPASEVILSEAIRTFEAALATRLRTAHGRRILTFLIGTLVHHRFDPTPLDLPALGAVVGAMARG